MTTATSWTVEDLVIARMAREMSGECIAVGATLLSDIAMRVAKMLYAPDLLLVGGSYAAADCEVLPKAHDEEWIAIQSAQLYMEWEDTFDAIRKQRFKVWIQPAQLDRYGNSNLSVIGDWRKPKVQLVGARGLPDDLWGVERFFYHLPDHTPRHLVERVDFICALGFGERRERLNLKTGLPGTVISNLGVFGWDEDGHFAVHTLHPGVSLSVVQERTGFALREAKTARLPVTEPPTRDEIACIKVVDPLGWRYVPSGQFRGKIRNERALAGRTADDVIGMRPEPMDR